MMHVLTKAWVLFWLFLIAREDLRSYTIPNAYTLAILAAAPVLCAVPVPLRILAALLPAVLIPLMGMGDVKLYSALGFVLGPGPLLRIACSSMLAGGVYAAFLLVVRKAERNSRIAFGPFIAGAAVLVLLSYIA